ncbi:MAG: hypothetical protein KY476_05630 [Planctomycetes bacterium]|nr:hypothetical protein [Planctomycetota bacterium]
MPRDLERLRPEIDAVLARLRRRIRRYVFVEGLALVLVVAGLIFWATLGLNWAWFQASKLELPLWFRAFLDVAAICLVVAGVVLWVAQRVLRRMRTRALALVLERRFPELDDRLITAVEVAESTTGRETPLTYALLARTIDDASRAAETVEVGDVFSKQPLRRAILAAVVLIASIVAFGLMNRQAMANWYRAFVGLDEVYWERETQLDLEVVPENAQPGDPPRRFVLDEDAGRWVYKHPRGGDLNLVAVVPEADVRTGKKWKVPDRVQLRYEVHGRPEAGSAYMSKTGERRFSYTLANRLDGLTFSVTGGDYVNRRPYVVEVVDPPTVDSVVLDCDYPDYMRLETTIDFDRDGNAITKPHPLKTRRVQGTEISLPMDTRFTMTATANKPLVGLRMECDSFHLVLEASNVPPTPKGGAAAGVPPLTKGGPGGVTGRLTTLREDGLPAERIELDEAAASRWLQPNTNTFRVDFVLASNAREQLAALQEPGVIPLPADTTLRIYLRDTDGIAAIEPSRLAIKGIVDQPPEADLVFRGIGEFITRKASIPIAGVLSDDVGLVAAHFAYKVGEKDQRISEADPWLTSQFSAPPTGYPKEFTLGGEGEGAVEWFSALPLELGIGQTLRLTVFVEDGDNVNGPHSIYAQPVPEYTFKVVSNEELLSILFQKEIGLRSRFEQIIREVTDTRRELFEARGRLEEMAALSGSTGQQAQSDGLRSSVQTTAERAIIQVAKNAQETKTVEVSFGDILDEMVNNAVLTEKMLERIRDKIVRPLGSINDIDFKAVDRAVGAFRAVHGQRRDATQELDRTLDEFDRMLANMHLVLAEMEDLAKFHESIEELRKIITEEQEIRDRTQQELEDILKKLQDLPID